IAKSGVWLSAAPAKPPINACDDDEGSPHHQVKRFHTIAPTSVARITFWVTASAETPLAMAADTCIGKTKKATKLKNAAQATAARGDSTRVETTVAIELSASGKPLMKSKASANAS